MEPKRIYTPLRDDDIQKLQAGDRVLLNGYIYTARDAAHQRLIQMLEEETPLPLSLAGEVIYYVGPTPAPEGNLIGSAGPTTSSRMDPMTPQLLDLGLKGMIGKGNRSRAVVEAMVENCAVYFAAIGGGGALISDCIVEVEVIAFEDLGTEAIRRMKVVDFPVIVAVDWKGNNYYEIGPRNYLTQIRANQGVE